MKHDTWYEETSLGKQADYTSTYQPDLLFSIPRQEKRDEIGALTSPLPFQGADIWNAFELSWLNNKGKPVVACAKIIVPAESPMIFESKSIKLYLMSFNNTMFDSWDDVQKIIQRDLSNATSSDVQVTLYTLQNAPFQIEKQFKGTSLDDLDVACDTYTTTPAFLKTEEALVTETLHSDLLRSNCLITNQPDWGSVQISYTGKKIQHEGLLKYIVSLRNHNEFHEQCVERLFMDILRHCHPEKLFVYARYTRRGGIDINPYRANYAVDVNNTRLIRQ